MDISLFFYNFGASGWPHHSDLFLVTGGLLVVWFEFERVILHSSAEAKTESGTLGCLERLLAVTGQVWELVEKFPLFQRDQLVELCICYIPCTKNKSHYRSDLWYTNHNC